MLKVERLKQLSFALSRRKVSYISFIDSIQKSAKEAAFCCLLCFASLLQAVLPLLPLHKQQRHDNPCANQHHNHRDHAGRGLAC